MRDIQARLRDVHETLRGDELQAIWHKLSTNHDAGIAAACDAARQHGLELSTEDISPYIETYSVTEEDDDVELDAATLTAVSGGEARGINHHLLRPLHQPALLKQALLSQFPWATI